MEGKLNKQLNNILLKELKKKGLNIRELELKQHKYTDVVGHYLNWMKRSFYLEDVKEIRFSKKMKFILNSNPKVRKKILKIADDMIRKKDLSKYTSKKTNKIKHTIPRNNFEERAELDKLLYDWGIFHFHLGENMGKKYVERSKELLYVFVYGGKAFFLDILNHEFCNSDLLEIINKNWPKLLKNHECQKFSHAETTRIKDARNKNLFYLTKIGEKYYFPIGGGLNSYGSSIVLMERTDFIQNNLDIIEEKLNEKEDEYKLVKKNKNLCLEINNQKYSLPADVFDNIKFFGY